MLIMLRSTIIGGIAIGASVHFIYFPTLAIFFGAIAGALAFFSLRHLQGRLEIAWGLYDTSGILSFAFFPSLFGGIISAILLAIYHYNGTDDQVINASSTQGIFGAWDTLQRKGGFQAGSTFISLALGATASLTSGFLVALHYHEHQSNFYND